MSINTAYYTPVEVIDTMWDIAKRLGFEGGNVLEGSAGIGNILASMPKAMSERSEITAVELDNITGGISRYLISLFMSQARNGFPWGTFMVNVAGCLLIGMLWGVTSRLQNISPSLSLLLMTGFCGGFTTFSTFSKEGLSLLQANSYILFLSYVIGSVALGLMAVALGYYTTK